MQSEPRAHTLYLIYKCIRFVTKFACSMQIVHYSCAPIYMCVYVCAYAYVLV